MVRSQADLAVSLVDDISQRLGMSPVGLRDVRIAAGARAELPDIVAGLSNTHTIAVLMDENDYRTVQGESLKQDILAALNANRVVRSVVLAGDVHADEKTVSKAVAACAGADVVVTIGSGTLCDIGKVAAGDRTHIVVQSAASVNGFADDQSVLLVNGVKRTTQSAWPHTLLIDQDVLAAAPPGLNQSGLGDMVSMFTAPADWYLASLFGMDRGFDLGTATMTRRYGGSLLAHASGIGASAPESLQLLAELLTLSGISMGVAGQTSPSSGMEHTVSHLLDMSNGSTHRPYAHHGEQVGVATVLVAVLWRRMRQRLASGTIGPLTIPADKEALAAVRTAFRWADTDGTTMQECWSDYSAKLEDLRRLGAPERLAQAIDNWLAHDLQLDAVLLNPERIVTALRDAGAPTRFRDLSEPIAAPTVTWALTNCHLMRNRFTIADLAYLTGNWGSSDVAAVIAEADELGAGL